MPEISVSFVRPLVATKYLGIAVGDAHMSDYQVIRFRVLSRDPVAIRLVGPDRPSHRATIEAWLAKQRETVPA